MDQAFIASKKSSFMAKSFSVVQDASFNIIGAAYIEVAIKKFEDADKMGHGGIVGERRGEGNRRDPFDSPNAGAFGSQ